MTTNGPPERIRIKIGVEVRAIGQSAIDVDAIMESRDSAAWIIVWNLSRTSSLLQAARRLQPIAPSKSNRSFSTSADLGIAGSAK